MCKLRVDCVHQCTCFVETHFIIAYKRTLNYMIFVLRPISSITVDEMHNNYVLLNASIIYLLGSLSTSMNNTACLVDNLMLTMWNDVILTVSRRLGIHQIQHPYRFGTANSAPQMRHPLNSAPFLLKTIGYLFTKLKCFLPLLHFN